MLGLVNVLGCWPDFDFENPGVIDCACCLTFSVLTHGSRVSLFVPAALAFDARTQFGFARRPVFSRVGGVDGDKLGGLIGVACGIRIVEVDCCAMPAVMDSQNVCN